MKCIKNWLNNISKTVEVWAENHIGLPIILIALAFVALIHPKFVYHFFFPVRTRVKQSQKTVREDT